MKPAYLSAIVTGLLIGTSYIPFPPWAIFFCFVPLWNQWLSESSWRQIFLTGWIAQFVLTLIGFNWVAHTVHEFGHLPWPVAFITLFLFCSFANLNVPLAGLAWFFFARKLKLKVWAQILALPLFFSIGERVFPMIFDWQFGYTWLWAKAPAYHLGDTIGFIGLSNIGLLFNGFVLMAFRRWREGVRWWPWVVAVPVAFGVLNLLGLWRLSQLPPQDQTTRMLIVQANIGNEEKIAAEQRPNFREVVFSRFTELTTEALAQNPGTDYVIWPETAFPEMIADPGMATGYPARLKEFITQSRIKLITGGYSWKYETRQVTNSFFVLSQTGEWLAPPYHKTILLAFGEYLPGADWFPSLRAKLPEVGNFGRGPGPSVLDGAGATLGAQICYEGLFDWFTRDLANKGAQIIVNVTNDSWYGTWMQPYQHLYMTLARAVEVRRPLVRSTNTGISTVILANGEILEASPLHEEWFHLYEVKYASVAGRTPFMGWGYYVLPVLIGLGLIGLAWRGRTTPTA